MRSAAIRFRYGTAIVAVACGLMQAPAPALAGEPGDATSSASRDRSGERSTAGRDHPETASFLDRERPEATLFVDRKRSDAPLTWTQTWRDFRYVFTRPAHLDRTGWIKLSSVLGAGASLYFVRDEVRDAAQRNRSEDLDDFLQTVRNMGKGASVPLVALGFFLSGAAGDSDRQRETAVILLESVTCSFAIATAGSFVVATERPEDGDSIRFFDTDGHGVSVDTAIAASMLAPIIDRHLRVSSGDSRPVRFWKRFGAGALYGAAGLVAYQRINDDKHYLPDVFFGYATGLGVGRLLVDARKGGRSWRDAGRRPTLSVTAGGFAIRW